ncbi:MAG: GNAT family N-acetyltransferase [Aeromicrobium sp.]|uniref:GNAT family N-acetyltransferase n=1 Tax=Aeromicrobium sp. TaxID=1871063 RepID=UPI003C66B748
MGTVTAQTDDDFASFHEVYLASYDRVYDCPWLAVEKRVNLTPDAYTDAIAVVARDDAGTIVGGGTAIMPLQDNRSFAFLDVFVHPNHRRARHGSAILDALLAGARDAGRTIGFIAPSWGIDEGTSAGREFAAARGFELDLVDATRELRLPATVPQLVVAGGYTLQSWRGPCPDDLIAEYADLRRILTEEAPGGEAGIENEHWDAARVRQDEADLATVGRVMHVVVARSPSGHLAGHTQLAFPDSDEVYQWDTLVRREHRGHRLGLALKVAMMLQTADLLAGRRRIITVNAASNEHMIAVNDALGFEQIAWVGEYVRRL